MRKSVLRGARVLAAVCAWAGASVVRAQDTLAPYVISRVTIVDPAQDALLRDAVIVVRGERVVAAGPRRAVAIPPGAKVIDAAGKFVMPGLWDMHTHVAQPVVPGAALEDGAAYFFPLFIAHGVTGVRDMAGELRTLRTWRSEIEQGRRVGPRLVITGEKLGRGPVGAGAPFPIKTLRDIQQSVKTLSDSGADFVKLDVVAADLARDVVRESWAFGMRVAGHVETQYSVRDLARYGLRSVEHLDGVLLAANSDEDSLRRELLRNERRTLWHRLLVKAGVRRAIAYPEAAIVNGYSEARADSLFDLFRRTGTWQTPTLRLLGTLYRQTDVNLKLAPDSLLPRAVPSASNGFFNAPFASDHPLAPVYPVIRQTVGRMSARGVGILAGTDTPGLAAVPGRSLHDELGLLVASGLSPRAALKAATSGAADYLEARDSLGTIRPGAFADLVLLDADPLADIGNTRQIRAVFARGRYYDRAALDRLIGEGAAAARRLRAATP